MPITFADFALDPVAVGGPVLSAGAQYKVAGGGLPARVTTKDVVNIDGISISDSASLCGMILHPDGAHILFSGYGTGLFKYTVAGAYVGNVGPAVTFRWLCHGITDGTFYGITSQNPAKVYEMTGDGTVVRILTVTGMTTGRCVSQAGVDANLVWVSTYQTGIVTEWSFTTGLATGRTMSGGAMFTHYGRGTKLLSVQGSSFTVRNASDLAAVYNVSQTFRNTTLPGDSATGAGYTSGFIDSEGYPWVASKSSGSWFQWNGSAYVLKLTGIDVRLDNPSGWRYDEGNTISEYGTNLAFLSATGVGVSGRYLGARIVSTAAQLAVWTWNAPTSFVIKAIEIPGRLRDTASTDWVKYYYRVDGGARVAFQPGEHVSVAGDTTFVIEVEFQSPLGRSIGPAPYVADPTGVYGPRFWYEYPDADAAVPLTGIRGNFAATAALRARLGPLP